eukprot:CAMPEP_0172797500 /NCGR_PEP_ID=MMETSP1075-20121228/429_1 /TAXON_ID=2916 /ORGANISM="Ceratium fusus, Strain PA161109" /LENGTH=98 /DNA_ID=CAMNT_0013634731 /DNA_START=130 /DNA_END=423 /DNA_ORIENTATION=-
MATEKETLRFASRPSPLAEELGFWMVVTKPSTFEDVIPAVTNLQEVRNARLLVHDRRAAQEADRVFARGEEGLRDHCIVDKADVVLPLAFIGLWKTVH